MFKAVISAGIKNITDLILLPLFVLSNRQEEGLKQHKRKRKIVLKFKPEN